MTKREPYSPDYTPEALRERLVAPLREIVLAMEMDLKLFEKTVEDGGIPRGYMPLSGKQAEASVAVLRAFQKGQLNKKLYAILDGRDIYRDQTKKNLKEKYKAEKRQNNSKK